MTDLMMDSGTSVLLDVNVTNPDGTVRDITGGALAFRVYDSPNGTLLFNGSTDITTPETGEGSAFLVPEDTSEVNGFHVWHFKITLTEADGGEWVVNSGKIFVNPQ